MSDLRQAVHDYLTLRRALGFKLERADGLLADFTSFVESEGQDHITSDLALRWATLPPTVSKRLAAVRLRNVRLFARYVSALDPRTEVPSSELLPYRKKRRPPYIFSDDDVTALLAAAGQLRSAMRRATYETLLGLLAVTGMRVGEAIALDRQDVNWASGHLVVRRGKFGKSRLLPLHDTTLRALHRYEQQRERKWRTPRCISFLVSRTGRRLIYNNVHTTFVGLLRASGLMDRAKPQRPRIHDLRHSFAVHTLIGWYHAGVDVEAQIPRLSTYLGHAAPSGTYWYLSATPELLAYATRRLERHWEDKP